MNRKYSVIGFEVLKEKDGTSSWRLDISLPRPWISWLDNLLDRRPPVRTFIGSGNCWCELKDDKFFCVGKLLPTLNAIVADEALVLLRKKQAKISNLLNNLYQLHSTQQNPAEPLNSIGALCRKHAVRDYLTFPGKIGVIGVPASAGVFLYQEYPSGYTLFSLIEEPSVSDSVPGNIDNDINRLLSELEDIVASNITG